MEIEKYTQSLYNGNVDINRLGETLNREIDEGEDNMLFLEQLRGEKVNKDMIADLSQTFRDTTKEVLEVLHQYEMSPKFRGIYKTISGMSQGFSETAETLKDEIGAVEYVAFQDFATNALFALCEMRAKSFIESLNPGENFILARESVSQGYEDLLEYVSEYLYRNPPRD